MLFCETMDCCPPYFTCSSQKLSVKGLQLVLLATLHLCSKFEVELAEHFVAYTLGCFYGNSSLHRLRPLPQWLLLVVPLTMLRGRLSERLTVQNKLLRGSKISTLPKRVRTSPTNCSANTFGFFKCSAFDRNSHHSCSLRAPFENGSPCPFVVCRVCDALHCRAVCGFSTLIAAVDVPKKS